MYPLFSEIWYDRSPRNLTSITSLPLAAVAAVISPPAIVFVYQNVNPVSDKWRQHEKYATSAAYFGCHSHIHARIVMEIGMLREDMEPDQNLEYLLNTCIFIDG